MPFGNAEAKQLSMPQNPEPVSSQASRVVVPVTGHNPETLSVESKPSESVEERRKAIAIELGQQLVDAGYENVRTASQETTLYIWWENNLYNRDERASVEHVARLVRRAGNV